MKLLPAYSLLLLLFFSCVTEHQADLTLKVADYQDEIIGAWQIKEQTCSQAASVFQDTVQFYTDGVFNGNQSDGTYWIYQDLDNEAGINLYVEVSGLTFETFLRIIELTDDELVLYSRLSNDEFCVFEFQRM